MKHLLSLLLTVGMLGLHGQNSKSSTNLNMEMYTLPNGLKVYLNEDHSQPEIYGGVAINAGSKQDPSDATGIAHYLEHMLFKGTETMGTTDFSQEKAHQDRIVELYDELAQTTDEEARKNIHKQINEESIKAAEFGINNEFDKLLKSIGSTGVNAFTSFEITFYHNTFPPNQVQKWLDIYAHRFQKPVFRTFQAELEVVYEEKNRAMDGFGYSIFETFLSNLFKNHPYGQQTTLGKTEHLKNPPLRKMYEFFDQYYVANNMALILCGDFNPEEVKPYIEASFGQLKSGEVPPYPEFPEAPFAGREEVKMRAAPVKIGALAFRTVPHMHPDRTTLEVADYILSNYSETGLLDKLALDGKLLMAQSQLLVNKDHGAQIYIFLPKIVGQSLNKAEDLVLTEIRKLAQGDFDEKLLEAAKLEMILEFEESLEDFENRGDLIGYSFVYGESWEEFMSFPGRVRNITKADVQKAAQSYFGENYLVLHSGRGFSKKDKIEKPDIEPVKPKEGNKSAYATYFEALPELEGSPRFVDFEKDIQARSLPGKSVLYTTENPLNQVFNLDLQFGAGTYQLPHLDVAANLMNYAHPEGKTLDEVKQTFQALGCSYSFGASQSFFNVSLSGSEEQLGKALELLGSIMKAPIVEDKKVKLLVDNELGGRKLNEREPSYLGQALYNYALYGSASSFLKRYNKAELKKLEAGPMLELARQAMSYQTTVHYSGRKDGAMVENLLNKFLPLSAINRTSEGPIVLDQQAYTENTILLLNDKRARQSQIYFYVPGEDFELKNSAARNAFNAYFGGGFSGLILQEIREFRSLAYSAGGGYRVPPKTGKPGYLLTFVGCQGDKTNEAIEVMMDLINNMPAKTERTALLRSNLRQSVFTSRPGFRNLSQNYHTWKRLGYTEDPNIALSKAYEGLEFEHLQAFYDSHIKGKPVVICLVGNKKSFDLDKLAPFGKVMEIDKKQIFR